MSIRANFWELSIATGSRDVLADFYGRALGYSFTEDEHGLIGKALDRRFRIVEGKPKSLDYAAYSVSGSQELDALRGRLRQAGTDFSELSWPGFVGTVLRIADPDNNIFLFGVGDSANGAFPNPTASRPARIQHVVFASTDPQRLIDFYCNVFGFVLSDEVLDDEGGLRTAFVRCSHEHHSLAVFKAPQNRLDHHCLEAGDWALIRDWADHFAAERIPLKWGPGRHGPGDNLFIFIHDPDENWVEISAELEVVTPGRPVGTWPHEERTLNSWGQGLLRS